MRMLIALACIFLMFGCVSQGPSAQVSSENRSLVLQTPLTNTSQGQGYAVPAVEENQSVYPNSSNVSTSLANQPVPLPSLSPTSEDPREVVVYFYSSGCAVCKSIENRTYEIEAEYNGSYRWVRFNVIMPQGRPVYLDYFNRFNLSEKDRIVPIAYVRNESFIMKSVIIEDLPQYLGGATQ